MPFTLPSLARDNLALYTIPAAWAIALAPRFYAVHLYAEQTAGSGDMDQRAPRDFIATVSDDPAVDAGAKARIVRAEYAQANGFENLGLFAAAVTAGSAAGVSPRLLNGVGLAYLASRVVFDYLYVVNETAAAAKARSAVYMGGVLGIFALFIEAGNKWRKPLFA